MKRKLFYILLIIYSLGLSSQTQKADLIFIDGDTIQGFGSITRNNKIKFKLTSEDKAEKWDFTIVKGITFYGYNEIKEFEYIALQRRQKPVLLEVKHRGRINIYEKRSLSYENSFGGEFPTKSLVEYRETYLKRDEEELAVNLSGFNFRKNALKYFKDCPEIVDMFESKEYKNYTIERIALYYNVYCSE